MIKLDLEEAEIPHKTEIGVRCFHSLRNSYISGLLDQGVPLTAVQRLARHSTPTLTAKYGKGLLGPVVLRRRFPVSEVPRLLCERRTHRTWLPRAPESISAGTGGDHAAQLPTS